MVITIKLISSSTARVDKRQLYEQDGLFHLVKTRHF